MTTSQQVYDLIVEQAARIVQQEDQIAAALALAVGHEDRCRTVTDGFSCSCRRGDIRRALGAAS